MEVEHSVGVMKQNPFPACVGLKLSRPSPYGFIVMMCKSVSTHFVPFQLLRHQPERAKRGACPAAPNLSLLKHQRRFLPSKTEPPRQEAF